VEPEVHIVERYMQLVKKCFTMTNIMLEGGKEIDLLAVNPISGAKYHIEVRVAIGKGFRLRLVDSQTKNGRKHRRGLDTLNEIKFSHPTVVKAVTKIFDSNEYKKVLVVWDVEEENVIEQAKSLYDIEVWKMSDLINQLTQEVNTKSYRDDVLRTIQLISSHGPA
jgi:PHP family Zn ribbon phosphoesterase